MAPLNAAANVIPFNLRQLTSLLCSNSSCGSLSLQIKAKIPNGLQDSTGPGRLPPLCPSLTCRKLLPLLNLLWVWTHQAWSIVFSARNVPPDPPRSPMAPISFPSSLRLHTTLSVRLSLKNLFKIEVPSASPNALHHLTLLYFFQ